MPVQVGPNPDLGWRCRCSRCKRERWHYLGVSAGPFNTHMAHCDVCGMIRNPPMRADNPAKNEPHTSRTVAERESDEKVREEARAEIPKGPTA